MADLTEYQEKAIQTITELDDVPMAMLYHAPPGPELFIQNDYRDRDDFSPHVQLLAAYVLQLATEMDRNTNEILRAADDKIREWDEKGFSVGATHRGSVDGEDA